MNSKQKGNRFELEIAKYLTKTTGKKYHRVGICSGSRATTQGLGKGFKGDVFSEEDDTYIECKSIKELKINELFSFSGRVFEWITKLEQQKESWVLFIKINNQGKFIISKMPNTLIMKNDTSIIKIFDKYYMTRLK